MLNNNFAKNNWFSEQPSFIMGIAENLKGRMPGGVHFSGLGSAIRIKKLEREAATSLEKAFLQAGKDFFIHKYFTGHTKANRAYLKKIYELIKEKFSASARLDINGILLPYAETDYDVEAFSNSILDVLLPEMVDNKTICDALTREGLYELGDVNIRPGDIVIDCGANMGMFSAMASRKGAFVYSFEPTEYLIQKYISKIAEWNPNINICKTALSDQRGKAEFVFENYSHGQSHLKAVDDAGGNTGETAAQPDGVSQMVDTITLDDFALENKLARIDFIKADIEGAERSMLKGAQRVLREFAPKLAICKYHLPDDPEVLRGLILGANPAYVIEERFKKIYAYVPDRK